MLGKWVQNLKVRDHTSHDLLTFLGNDIKTQK